jgi:DNA repair photolyase
MILNPFDPWKNPLCCCPPKLSLNPYTGCPHGCLYCYASSYIPRFHECRPKADLLKRLGQEAKSVLPGTLVAMSNSSDPYPFLEKDLFLSRGCLQVFKERGLRVQVVTKSDMISRDVDLLVEMDAAVAITVTTMKDSVSRSLEPGAPPPAKRLEAVRRLTGHGVPVSVRIDPIIPGINDGEIEELVLTASNAGACHITTSTYKARPNSLKAICSAFPESKGALEALFRRGDRKAGCSYLPEDVRMGFIRKVERIALREGLTFAACREGVRPVAGVQCDGSHIIIRK